MTNLRLRLVESFTIFSVDYFAIHEWFITGTCLCNGHGMCSPVTGDTVEGKVSYWHKVYMYIVSDTSQNKL